MSAAPLFSEMILKAVVTAPSQGHTTQWDDRQHIILTYNLKFHLPAQVFSQARGNPCKHLQTCKTP